MKCGSYWFLDVASDRFIARVESKIGRRFRPSPLGRRCGEKAYVKKIEARTGRDLTPKKPGPRPKKTRR
jgi:hypothetical protein